jgi:hypothetical protein
MNNPSGKLLEVASPENQANASGRMIMWDIMIVAKELVEIQPPAVVASIREMPAKKMRIALGADDKVRRAHRDPPQHPRPP